PASHHGRPIRFLLSSRPIAASRRTIFRRWSCGLTWFESRRKPCTQLWTYESTKLPASPSSSQPPHDSASPLGTLVFSEFDSGAKILAVVGFMGRNRRVNQANCPQCV